MGQYDGSERPVGQAATGGTSRDGTTTGEYLTGQYDDRRVPNGTARQASTQRGSPTTLEYPAAAEPRSRGLPAGHIGQPFDGWLRSGRDEQAVFNGLPPARL